MLAPWKKSYDQPRQYMKKQRHYFANKGPYSQSCGLSSSYVWMWALDYKESWMITSWCFWTVELEKTLECPLDSKEIKPVSPKGNLSGIFIRRTDAEAPILWPPDAKHRLIGKYLVAERDWVQEKGVTEDEMVGWYHQLNGHEFEQTLGDSEGRGSLACCSPWGCRVWYNLATAVAKSLQSCPTLCDPIDGSPPGSSVPRILQARTLEWVAISFSSAWKWKVTVKLLSRVRLSDPMDCSPPGSNPLQLSKSQWHHYTWEVCLAN